MALFENFPYTNLHNLNLDWIIKIAKDFLDQYTHIQQLISDGETSLQNLTEEGLQQLQEKAVTLEELLQEWYNTHSSDIANQLADALADLNAWYTTHQNYLDNTLTEKITAFNNAADQKAAETLASIPDDYTTLANNVLELTGLVHPLSATWESGSISFTTGNPYSNSHAIRTQHIEKPDEAYTIMYVNPNKRDADIYFYDESLSFIEQVDLYKHETGVINFPRYAKYFRLVLSDVNAEIEPSFANGFYICAGLEGINNDVFRSLKIKREYLETTDYTGDFANLDTFPINEIVLITNANRNAVNNLPILNFTGYIITINHNGNQLLTNRHFTIQIAYSLYDGLNNIYYRAKYSAWTEWKIIDNQFFESFKGLKNFTVLGDSTSISLSYPTTATGIYVKSWALIMANDMNATPSIYAEGGITTGGMLTSPNYQQAVANSNNNQFAMILLGINDANNNIAISTFENNYRQLISDMLVNHKFIFCATIPAGLKGAARIPYNEKIKEICSGVQKAFLLDIDNYSKYIELQCHNGHMSSTGYALLCNIIEKEIDKTLTTESYFISGGIDQ